MLIIGCDFHTRYQQIAMAREETGELLVERRLDHESGEAHAFYRSLQEPVRVGMEARLHVGLRFFVGAPQSLRYFILQRVRLLNFPSTAFKPLNLSLLLTNISHLWYPFVCYLEQTSLGALPR